MNNRDKRNAVAFSGVGFTFINIFMASLWFFEKSENKAGVAFVWMLLNVGFLMLLVVVTIAFIKYPPWKDDER